MRNHIWWTFVILLVMFAACDDPVVSTDLCGDGFIDPGEQCDGADLNGQSCESLGYYIVTGQLACTATCQYDTTACGHRCGDGLLDVQEDCDDGDGEDGDGCSARCRVEEGWTCTEDSPSLCEETCGDRMIVGDEDCEDGLLNGATCESLGFEPGELSCTRGCAFDTSLCGELVGRVADHEAVAAFDGVDQDDYAAVAAGLNIYYGHTSHGSQLVTGLQMLDHLFNYGALNLTEEYGDLGHEGDLTWSSLTETHLQENPETNVVIWSWCGGVSDNTAQGILTYLDEMERLEGQYPEVTFVYMTGHLDGSGELGTLRVNNRQIRDFCVANDKWLFDFEDIESWDPAGNYYPDETDACGWCTDWCETNTCGTCGDCAHSHCFNCERKGRAFWWLLARLVRN